jgi:predicted ATPase
LARQGQFLEDRGLAEWPDGTVSGCYGFRHALYQEVVYQRLGVGQQARWHRVVGARLEQAYGVRTQEVAAELALHFQRGHDVQRSVQYLGQAADNAAQRHAPHEVSELLTTALAALQTLPKTAERAQQELTLQLALGPALMAIKGPAAPEVEQTYAQARALCTQIGETPQLFAALRGLCLSYRNRGMLPMARELGEQLLRLVQRDTSPTPRLEAHETLGNILLVLGECAAAWTHFEQGIALIDSTAQRALALRNDVAPGVRCLAFGADTLWCLGYPEQALRRCQEALILAQEIAHPYSLATAQHDAAWLHQRRREAPAVQAQAEVLLSLATAQGFPLYMGYAMCWRGWALAMQGQGEAGLAQLHQGLAAALATGQTMARPFYLVLLAEIAGHAGQVAEGLRLLDEALEAFEASGRGDLLTEVYRLQGEFLLRQALPDPARAETCLQQALAIARRQQAKSWELRAATSLSRLWQQQGKDAEARELLAPFYSWFTEGFDTADLQEAQALLDALS